MTEDKSNTQSTEESRKRVPLSEMALSAWNTMSNSNKGAAMARYIDIGLEYERIGLSQPMLASLEASGILSFVNVLISDKSSQEAKQGALEAIATATGVPLTGFVRAVPEMPAEPAVNEKAEEELEILPTLDIGGGLL